MSNQFLSGIYHRWLRRDLDNWVDKGWVTAEGRDHILTETTPKSLAGRLPAIIAVLGAVLLGFAVMSFVSANWQEMSKLARMVLLLGAMWTALIAAWWLRNKGWPFLHEALGLIAACVFGANIMLIAQMYHIDSHFPDGILMWALGALLISTFLECRAALGLAFLLLVTWSGYEILQFDIRLHWPFLPVWALATAIALWQRWIPGYHLAILALGFWIVVTTMIHADLYRWSPAGTFSLFAAMALIVTGLAHALPRWVGAVRMGGFHHPLERYGLLAFATALFTMQMTTAWHGLLGAATTGPWFGWQAIAAFCLVVSAGLLWVGVQGKKLGKSDALILIGLGIAAFSFALFVAPQIRGGRWGLIPQWAFAALFIGFSLWLITYGQRNHDKFAINLGLLSFGAEVLYIYFEVFGSLLETSLFFLVGGLVLIGLAIFLERMRRRLTHDEQTVSSPPEKKGDPA